MAPIADGRLAQLAPVERSAKVTPAVIRVQDVPGTGPALLGNLRKVDALLCHSSQVHGPADSVRAVVRQRAEEGGRGAGLRYAEAFRVLRFAG